MKIYTSYTENASNILELLLKSAEEIQDIEIVPCLIENAVIARMGRTSDDSYKTLMIQRWKMLPNLVKENLGSNIVWLDLDCVFNKTQNKFIEIMNSALEEHDFAFQEETNSGMSARINTGIMGIKCSEKTYNFVQKCVSDIENTPANQRESGFPLFQWNDAFTFNKYPECECTYTLLPDKMGYESSDCVIYHAIATEDKMGRLRDVLNSFLIP
jgi:hypothetical protein